MLHLASDDNFLGAPHSRPADGAYVSSGGMKVTFEVDEVFNPAVAVGELVDQIDDYKGE
jgi:hypothetical protein